MAVQAVRPGDLIKAEQWNQLIEALSLIDARVTALEGSNEQIQIIDLQYTAPLRVGGALRILGRNFRTPTTSARVFIDGHEALPDPVTATSSILDVHIPEEVDPPTAGKQVQLLVSNVETYDVRRLTVLPRVIVLNGPIDVQWVGVQPAEISANSDVVWGYTVRSRASRAETFQIAARILPEGLIDTAQFQFFVADRITTPLSSITLDPAETTPVRLFARLNPFPNIPQNTRFSLFLELSVGGQTYKASDPESFTVGQTTQQPDSNIELTISGVNPERDAAGNLVWIQPNIVQFRSGVPQVQVQLLATFIATPPFQSASYQLTAGIVAGWSVDGSDNASEYRVTEAEWAAGENNGASRVTRSLTYFIQPAAGAAERTLTVNLQRQGESRHQEISLILRPSN